MIDPKDLKADVLPLKATNTKPHHPPGFVRVKHIPSGITVTKYYVASQIQAKACAESELDELVELWEGGP